MSTSSNINENREGTHPRLEPVHKFDDMGVLQALKHVKLVVDHPLVALDILLQDDLDSDLAFWAVGLSDNSIGTCAECSSEAVFGPGRYWSATSPKAAFAVSSGSPCTYFLS